MVIPGHVLAQSSFKPFYCRPRTIDLPASVIMSRPDQEPSFSFLPLGAIIQEFRVGGRNIVQNFPTPDLYRHHNSPYFGETIGRVANRIARARLHHLNGGRTYQLAANEGPHALHGGCIGWGKREFEGPTPVDRDGREAVLFLYVSPDGEEGYPGTVECRVWYKAWTEEVEEGVQRAVLEMEYEVEMAGEVEEEVEETVVNVTNHRFVIRKAQKPAKKKKRTVL